MSDSEPALSFRAINTGREVHLRSFCGFVAGYTGRDAAAVQHHIDELAAIGVAAPPEVPMFYAMPAHLFTSSAEVGDAPSLTSGEVEPLYIRSEGRFFLGVASDHTDRELEAQDVALSKRACAKPVGAEVIEITDLDTLSLDDARARCWRDDVLYQDGSLSALRPAAEIVRLLIERTDVGDDDFVCLGGTLSLLGGGFQRGDVWRVRLDLPDSTGIEHTYTMRESTT